MNLASVVDPEYFRNLAKKHFSANKFNDAALIIHKFKFHADFDCLTILEKLAMTNKMQTARMICDLDETFKIHLIKTLSTNEHCKTAGQLVKDFKFDINSFPELKERLLKSSMRYYLGRYLYKKPKDEDYMSLERVEDLMLGLKPMLSYLAEDLAHKGKKNEALGLCIRNDLLGMIREDIKEDLADIVYDPKKEVQQVDKFGPISGDDLISLPEHVKVEWIGSPDDINKLDALLSEPYIGVDSEWRPSLAKFHNTKPALFQIGGAGVVFLIDFFTLQEHQGLDAKLSQIFSNPNSVIVGFAFNSDVDQFAKKFPNMKFFRYINRFIDA